MTDRVIALLNEKWDDFEKDGTLAEPWRPRPTNVNESELRMRGHNKDGHPESPQVKVALVCGPGGVVLRHRVYAGNVGDTTITKDLVERLTRRNDGAATVWVADAGMKGKEQMSALDGAGCDRVTAEPLRKSALGLELFNGTSTIRGPEFGHDGRRFGVLSFEAGSIHADQMSGGSLMPSAFRAFS